VNLSGRVIQGERKLRTQSSRSYTTLVNGKISGARSLAYFKNRTRDTNRFGNWHRDSASNRLIFSGGWCVDVNDLQNGADAFRAMADFAKFATTADDVADLGRALRKIAAGVLS
jgi:hypothetical protein